MIGPFSDLIAGVFFVALSFAAFLIPHSAFTKFSSLLVGASFYLGVLLISSWYIFAQHHPSVFGGIFRHRRERNIFLALCLLMGTFFGFIVSDLGGFWYFPYWSATDYVLIGYVFGGWAFYILTLITCYEAGKLFFDRIFRFRKVTKYYAFEKYLYRVLLVIGTICVAIVAKEALVQTNFFFDFIYTIHV